MAEELAPHAILPESWSVKEVVADLKADLKADQASLKTDIVSHLDKQDLALAEISAKVDTKANKSDLVEVVSELRRHVDLDAIDHASHGKRISTLEDALIESGASKKFRNRVWAIIGSVSGTIAILVSALIAAHGG